MATPVVHHGNWNCSNNELYSLDLENIPRYITGSFICYNNELTSLEGAPFSIGGSFNGGVNKLTSLHNIHKIIKFIDGHAYFESNPITSCVLGLLLIDGLKSVYLDHWGVRDIINKHLASDRDVFACQEELIENGFEEFAKL